MAMRDVTPIMTSANTPLPYQVTTSNFYGAGLEGWQCFRGDASQSWLSKKDEHLNTWIMLDFGKLQKISLFKFTNTSSTSSDWMCMPKSMEIQGSVDGVNFKLIKSIYDERTWKQLEYRLCALDSIVEYRYYKFLFKESLATNSNGNAYMTFGRIDLFYDSYSPVTSSSSHIFTSPMNSIEKILGKLNDPREGLIGICNDSNNYGDLYFVGSDGKSHSAKAGVRAEVIWEGAASNISTYQLSRDVANFKYIVVTSSMTGYTHENIYSTYGQKQFVVFNEMGLNRYAQFSCTKNILEIFQVSLGGLTSFTIEKIIGIY